MVDGDVPLVVCVSGDVAVRERVVRRLDDCGAVLMCASLDELRAMLFPAQATTAGQQPASAARGAADGDDLVVDAAGHLVTWRGRPLPLTRLERDLLGRLASPPVGVWTYRRLFDAVWGKDFPGDPAILHSAVKRLRGKLRAVDGGLVVETVRGVGYRLSVPR